MRLLLLKSPYYKRYWRDDTNEQSSHFANALLAVLSVVFSFSLGVGSFFYLLYWESLLLATGGALLCFLSVLWGSLKILQRKTSTHPNMSRGRKAASVLFQIIGGTLICLGLLMFPLQALINSMSSANSNFIYWIGLACLTGGIASIIRARVRLMATPTTNNDDDDNFVSPWQSSKTEG